MLDGEAIKAFSISNLVCNGMCMTFGRSSLCECLMIDGMQCLPGSSPTSRPLEAIPVV
jgi:hypothetical protein